MVRKLIFILLLGVVPSVGFAQKAFEAVVYKTKLQNKQNVKLTLANGYIGGSQISMINKGKAVLFTPDSGVPDEKAQITFHAEKQLGYFTLDNMQEGYEELPRYINGIYRLGNKKVAVRFLLSAH